MRRQSLGAIWRACIGGGSLDPCQLVGGTWVCLSAKCVSMVAGVGSWGEVLTPIFCLAR